MALQILMLVFGVIAIITGIIAVIFAFAKGEEMTSKKVVVPGAICLISLVLFIVMYKLI